MICADARGMLCGLNQINIFNCFFFILSKMVFSLFALKTKLSRAAKRSNVLCPLKTLRLLLLASNGSLSASQIAADLLNAASMSPGLSTSPSDPRRLARGFLEDLVLLQRWLRQQLQYRRQRAGVHGAASASMCSTVLVWFWFVPSLMWSTCKLHGCFIGQTQRSARQRWPSEPTGARLCSHCGDSYHH